MTSKTEASHKKRTRHTTRRKRHDIGAPAMCWRRNLSRAMRCVSGAKNNLGHRARRRYGGGAYAICGHRRRM